jgi:hypothetical protein
MKSWRVLDYGSVPRPPARSLAVNFTCTKCGCDSVLPVVGITLAQLDDGLVFDPGPRAVPKVIQCRNCRRVLELEVA